MSGEVSADQRAASTAASKLLGCRELVSFLVRGGERRGTAQARRGSRAPALALRAAELPAPLADAVPVARSARSRASHRLESLLKPLQENVARAYASSNE